MTVDAHEARLTIPPPPQPRTDHPGNFIFLDPPYGVSSVKNYTGWDESDLTTFRDRVVDLKSRWIVTLDDSPNNTDIADPIRIRLCSSFGFSLVRHFHHRLGEARSDQSHDLR